VTPTIISIEGKLNMNNLSTQIGALELSHLAAGFDDGALEASQANPPTMSPFPGRHCISDGALELAAREENIAGPVSAHYPGGRCY
jgi:hypothetical protein